MMVKSKQQCRRDTLLGEVGWMDKWMDGWMDGWWSVLYDMGRDGTCFVSSITPSNLRNSIQNACN